MSAGGRGLDIIVVPETHWDREWFLPFERFRARLIDVVDEVLRLLDQDPGYTFMLDGQTIVLEDYLALRPERRADLERHARSGRLAIGPWHVLPDEFLVSGEALVRNLAEGARVGADFGGVMRVGYTPDPFGHVAQLPQILRGLGIDTFVFSRGIGDELDEVRDLFEWAAPDGSTVLAHHQLLGYGPAAALPRDHEAALASLTAIRDRLADGARVPVLLVGNGSDHSRPQAHVPELLRLASERGQDRYRLGRLEHYFELARAANPDLPRLAGELRGARLAPILAGVASARQHIKSANASAQHALERLAEPAAALAAHLGADVSSLRPLLRHAWRVLLENHPHDSICGCSVDEVHQEMMPRFARAEQVAAEVIERATRLASARLPALEGTPLIVLNPEAWPVGGVRELELLVTAAEADAGLGLSDPRTGEPLELEVLGRETQIVGVLEGDPTSAAQWFEQLADRHPVRDLTFHRDGTTLVVLAEEGPALGASDDLIERAGAASRAEGVSRVRIEIQRTRLQALARLPSLPGLAYRALELRAGAGSAPAPAVEAGPRRLGNGRLEVEVEPDGTLAVTVLATGRTYRGLHRLQDIADAGDEYTHQPLGEPPVTSIGRLTGCELLETSALRASLRLTWTLVLPARLAPGRQARATETVVVEVHTTVSLAADSQALELETTFINTAEDHRLQVVFPDLPASPPTTAVLAGSAFYLASRPIDPPSAVGWSEPPADAHPFTDVVAAASFALASRDLTEYSAVRGQNGLELALTLVRSVGFLARGDLSARPGLAGPPYPTPEAQCLGPRRARYRWAPLDESGAGRVLQAAHRELVVLQAHRAGGDGQLEGQLLDAGPAWWATALKPGEAPGAVSARLVRVEAGARLPDDARVVALDEKTPAQDSGTAWAILTLLASPAGAHDG